MVAYANTFQAAAFLLQGRLNAASRRKRVSPPGFFESSDEHVVAGFKVENLIGKADGFQFAQSVCERIEELAAAHVADESDPVDPTDGLCAQLSELGHERRWNVVDAKVAQIFETPNGFRFSRSGKPCDDHKPTLLLFTPRNIATMCALTSFVRPIPALMCRGINWFSMPCG